MGAGAGRIAILALSFVLWGEGGARAGADSAPVIVIPGRPGIPIMINGRDATGAVIEGDWGLAREQIGITIIRPPIWPLRRRDAACWNGLCGAPVARYFPGTGRPPPVGRLEILPPANRALPPPAEGYYRFWGIESAPLPPTIEPPHYDIPPVIIGRCGTAVATVRADDLQRSLDRTKPADGPTGTGPAPRRILSAQGGPTPRHPCVSLLRSA